MGMAHRSPENREHTYFVSKHAMDRIRQRAKITVQLDDMAIAGLVSEAIDNSLEEQPPYEVVDEKGDDAKLVELTSTLDPTLAIGTVFALIKPEPGKRDAVVTILDQRGARKLIRTSEKDKPFNPAFSKLAGMKATEPQIPTNGSKPPGVTQPQPPSTQPQAVYLVLAPGGEVVKTGSKEEVASYIANDSHPSDLKLFKECIVKVKTEIKVEID